MKSEAQIIQTLQAKSQGFIGDDAAILPDTNGFSYVISKDLLIEAIHFRTQYFTPEDLAHKALHVNLSDLAAMGASPLYILCGISIPPNLQNYALNFMNSLTLYCQDKGVILIGGDTTASKDKLFISITAIGQIFKAHIKYRNTANEGEWVCVAGNLGWAHLGFIGLEKGVNTHKKYINSFLRPEAKIKEGIWLGKQPCVTSMMDISDGLYIDLKRLCQASNKGAIIDLDRLQQYLLPELSLRIMLEGGEDYGLLFTLKKEALTSFCNAFLEDFQYDIKIIGYLMDDSDVIVQQGGKFLDLNIKPFTHFGE